MPLVSVLYDDGNNVFEGSFRLNAILLSGLAVTKPPNKIKYFEDEEISYAGMVVTATFSDGTTEIVTDKCTISPPEGAAFDDTYVEITYAEGKIEKSCSLTLTPITLSRIEVTTPPTKTKYFEGEPISYADLTVTAYYSDGTTEDITDKCTITPPEGKAFDDDTYVEISYGLYSCSLTLENAESHSLLQITTPPNKVSYFVGEKIDYAGIVVSAVYDDGTQHDVTAYCDFDPVQGSVFTGEKNTALIRCAPPVETYVYNYASGYVYNGKWRYQNSPNDITDIYKVEAGHTYLLTLGETIGTRFCAMFTTEDISKVTSGVTGTKIVNNISPAKYSNVTYTPSTDGYIAISKDNAGALDLRSYLYDTTTTNKTKTVSLNLETVTQSFYLTGNAPNKTAYHVTEPLDYSGCKIYAYFADGKVVDVTSNVVFDPIESTAFTPDMQTISASYTYDGDTQIINFDLSSIELVSLTVNHAPDKVYYSDDETLSFSGGIFYANYSDGTHKAIASNKLTFDPAEGTVFPSDALSVVVDVSYTDDYGESASTSFTLEAYRLRGLEVNFAAHPEYFIGEELDYSEFFVNAIYMDERYEDVTEDAVFTPSAGTIVDENFTEITVTYTNKRGETATASYTPSITASIPTGMTIQELPYKMAYKPGEIIDTNGLQVVLDKSDGTQEDITSQIDLSAYNGHRFMPDEITEIPISTQITKIHATLEDYDYDTYRSLPGSVGPAGVTFDRGLHGWVKYTPINGETQTFNFRHIWAGETQGHSVTPPQVNEKWACGRDYEMYTEYEVNPMHYPVFGYKLFKGTTQFLPLEEGGSEGLILSSEYFNVDWDKEEVRTEYDGSLVIPGDSGWEEVVGYNFTFYPIVRLQSEYSYSDNIDLTAITIDSLSITPPKKTAYKFGEKLDYSGIKVIAHYSDDSTEDITSSCTFTPANGSTYHGESNVQVSYNGEQFRSYTGCTYFNPRIRTISVSPTHQLRAYYQVSIEYSYEEDGQTITNYVNIPLDQYYTHDLDFPHYQDDKGSYRYDENDEPVYDVFFKVCRVVSEEPEVRNGVLGFRISTYENLPSSDMVAYNYDLNKLTPYKTGEPFIKILNLTTSELLSDSFELSAITLTSLEIAELPTIREYHVGDAISYDGLRAYAHYSDNTSEFVYPTFIPPEGSIATADMDSVTVSYTRGGETVSASYAISVITLTGIEVTPPHKTTYKVGETIDYTGLEVVAVYSDETKHTVTNNCYRDPSEGAVVTEITQNMLIGYMNAGKETAEHNIALNIITLDSLTITDTAIYKLGDVTDYSSVSVLANYSDNTSEDVSSLVTYSNADGQTITKTMQRNVTVTYNKAAGVSITGEFELKLWIIKWLEVTPPTKLSYIKGETLDLTGLDVVCRYTDETSANVTSQISLNVTNGAVVDSETPKEVIITYTESFDVVTYSFLLDILIIDSLEITPPTKTSYDNGDTLDLTGLKVICKYTDGTTADVTSSVSLSVEEGAVVDEDTSNEITITYTDGTETVTGQFEIEII